jgi:hypothetical protein
MLSESSSYNPSKLKIHVKLFFMLCMMGCFVVDLPAQTSSDIYEARKKLEESPEVYIVIPAKRLSRQIADAASLDYIEKGRAFLYANREALDLIIASGVPFSVRRSPGRADFPIKMLTQEEMLLKSTSSLSWDFYPTYEAYVAMMHQFELDFPGLVKIYQIGTTVMGRALLLARIGPDTPEPRPVPQVMYTSTMHGDETTGFILSLRLIHHLAGNYGVDEHITDLLNKVDVWICPNENPDGTYTNDNSTINGATRFNANGKDLNRNYPGPHPNHTNPPDLPIQPETQAMIDFVSNHNFIMSANMHGGAELANFPWDAWKSNDKKHADHDWWEYVLTEYADTVRTFSPSTYFKGMGDGVTHGGDWYVVYGSRQDYMNYFHSIREFTLELSNQKLLNPALLPAHWEYNHRSLINYIRQATYGIHGIVKSAATGEPLLADIVLSGHDHFNSHISTSGHYGYFSRPVYTGTYNVTVESDGFPVGSISGLQLENYETLNLEIRLGDDPLPLYVYSTDKNAGSVRGKGIYAKGYEAILKALPERGFSFSHWRNDTGEILSESQEYTVTVTGFHPVYYAVFDTFGYIVDFETGSGRGDVTAFADDIQLQSGQRVTAGKSLLITAVPAPGFRIESWVIDGIELDDFYGNEYVVENISANIEVIVNFTPAEYVLVVNVSDPEWGSVTTEPEKNIFNYGETVQLTALPATGFAFELWLDVENDIFSQDADLTFNMPAYDVFLTAVFRIVADDNLLSGEHDVVVYPNPSTGKIYVKAAFQLNELELMDISGRTILKLNTNGRRDAEVSLAGFSSGFYLLRVFHDNGPVVRKIRIL